MQNYAEANARQNSKYRSPTKKIRENPFSIRRCFNFWYGLHDFYAHFTVRLKIPTPRAYILQFRGLDPSLKFFTHYLCSNVNFFTKSFYNFFVNRVFGKYINISHWFFLTNSINSRFRLFTFF